MKTSEKEGVSDRPPTPVTCPDARHRRSATAVDVSSAQLDAVQTSLDTRAAPTPLPRPRCRALRYCDRGRHRWQLRRSRRRSRSPGQPRRGDGGDRSGDQCDRHVGGIGLPVVAGASRRSSSASSGPLRTYAGSRFLPVPFRLARVARSTWVSAMWRRRRLLPGLAVRERVAPKRLRRASAPRSRALAAPGRRRARSPPGRRSARAGGRRTR